MGRDGVERSGNGSQGKDLALSSVTAGSDGGEETGKLLHPYLLPDQGNARGLTLSPGPWWEEEVLMVLLEQSWLFWDAVDFIAQGMRYHLCLLALYFSMSVGLVENLACNIVQLLPKFWWGIQRFFCWVRETGYPVFCVHSAVLSLITLSPQWG